MSLTELQTLITPQVDPRKPNIDQLGRSYGTGRRKKNIRWHWAGERGGNREAKYCGGNLSGNETGYE